MKRHGNFHSDMVVQVHIIMDAHVLVTRYVELLFDNSCYAQGHDLQVS